MRLGLLNDKKPGPLTKRFYVFQSRRLKCTFEARAIRICRFVRNHAAAVFEGVVVVVGFVFGDRERSYVLHHIWVAEEAERVAVGADARDAGAARAGHNRACARDRAADNFRIELRAAGMNEVEERAIVAVRTVGRGNHRKIRLVKVRNAPKHLFELRDVLRRSDARYEAVSHRSGPL